MLTQIQARMSLIVVLPSVRWIDSMCAPILMRARLSAVPDLTK